MFRGLGFRTCGGLGLSCRIMGFTVKVYGSGVLLRFRVYGIYGFGL